MTSRQGIFLYYLCGVFAAGQLGKLAALAPLIAQELHVGLAAMAGITALLEVCGAVLGARYLRTRLHVSARRWWQIRGSSLVLGLTDALGDAHGRSSAVRVYSDVIEKDWQARAHRTAQGGPAFPSDAPQAHAVSQEAHALSRDPLAPRLAPRRA